MTYEEIGQRLGLTRSAVYKIEQRALQKLRRALTEKGLSFEDLVQDSPSGSEQSFFEGGSDGTQAER